MDVMTMITVVVGNRLKSLFDNLVKEFGEEIKQAISSGILDYQIEEYNRNYCTKTLLHRVQPKNLKDFYQPLFINPCEKRNKIAGSTSKKISTNSISDLFAKRKCITLIGSAGSGKSTLLKYLFLNAIDTSFKIPIKIELRYLNDYSGSLIDFIKDRVFKLNKLATSERIIERLMNSGDFIFFLDGYDEVTSAKKEKITKEIDNLVKLYNKGHYLLTSRPYTEIDLLPLFHNFEVCELSDEDINQFIRKQIPKEESELCNKIIEAVNSQENISYKSFLKNPLLLSMFILTFQSYSSIPQKRSEFYSQVFDALFSVHDSMSKLAFVREKQSGLSKEQIVEVLKLFSFISYFDEKFIFTGLYLNEKLKFIKNTKKNISFDNDKLINDLQVAIGILNKEGTDYTFPHRSLQEYFAALYIFSLNEDNKKIVYDKIINSFTRKKRHMYTSRDNFYLLLSELDERSVIKYALIPYFQQYIEGVNIEENQPQLIIENFMNIHSIFESFEYILESNLTVEANEHFNHQYHKYMKDSEPERIEQKNNNNSIRKINDKIRLDAVNKLAIEDIKPFLKNFVPKLKNIKQELADYLVNESNSDNEIVSLI